MYRSDIEWDYVRLSQEIGPTIWKVVLKRLRLKKAVVAILPYLWSNRRMRIFVLESLHRMSKGKATLDETLKRLCRCRIGHFNHDD
jgi:hypothetical protein